MSKSHILIIDDEPDIRGLISDILSDEGYQVSTAEDGASARKKLNEITPDLVLLDIWMPDIDGISLLKSWKESGNLRFPVVMMSGHGTIETAIEATKMGAKDFVEKPISLAKLLQTIDHTLTQYAKEDQTIVSHTWKAFEPIGNSKSSRQLREQLDRIKHTHNNTLFVGDGGTGKLNTAKYLHQLRNNNQQATVISDTLSWPEQDVTTTLTQLWQKISDQEGQKSIIISNIDCLISEQQNTVAAILKQWQQQSIAILSTAQQDLKTLVLQGDFSRELYDLIAEITLYLPHLNARSEDVPELINFYINYLPDHEQIPYRKMSFAAQNFLRNHDWPGNIRELKNIIRQLQILGKEGDIEQSEVEQLLAKSQEISNNQQKSLEWYDLDLREAREAFERDYLLHHLQQVNGKVGELAKIVGLERTHLYRKLRALNINTKDPSKSASSS